MAAVVLAMMVGRLGERDEVVAGATPVAANNTNLGYYSVDVNS